MILTKTLKNCEEKEAYIRKSGTGEVIISIQVGATSVPGTVNVMPTGDPAAPVPTGESDAVETAKPQVKFHYVKGEGGADTVTVQYEVSAA